MWQPPMVRRVLRNLPPTVRSVLLHARGDYVPWEGGFDVTPPTLVGEEFTGPPDFVGVGVQKAGTSWWFDLIREHPGVHDRPEIRKELHLLSRYCTESFGPEAQQGYCGWFPRLPGTIAGEWTPDYFAFPWVAPLLAEVAPEARILVLVRDPVDRFQSGLTFRIQMGAPRTSTTVSDAVRQGFYARHLRNFLDWFPPERVLVLQYEQCRADPVPELARTYEFLGLDPFEPGEIRREVNVNRWGKVPMDPAAAARLADLYRSDMHDLAGLVPSLDLSLWPSVADGGGAP